MNVKLLTELVEKADKDFALALVPADTLEKFAELLIRECAFVGRGIGGINVSDAIMKRFGVENA